MTTTTILEFYRTANTNPSAYVYVSDLTRDEFDAYIHETHIDVVNDLVGFYQGSVLIGVYSTAARDGYYAIK